MKIFVLHWNYKINGIKRKMVILDQNKKKRTPNSPANWLKIFPTPKIFYPMQILPDNYKMSGNLTLGQKAASFISQMWEVSILKIYWHLVASVKIIWTPYWVK